MNDLITFSWISLSICRTAQTLLPALVDRACVFVPPTLAPWPPTVLLWDSCDEREMVEYEQCGQSERQYQQFIAHVDNQVSRFLSWGLELVSESNPCFETLPDPAEVWRWVCLKVVSCAYIYLMTWRVCTVSNSLTASVSSSRATFIPYFSMHMYT